MPRTTNPHWETGLRHAKTVQRTRWTPQQSQKNCHDRKRQIIGTSRRMCVQGMPTAYVDGCSYNREGKLQAGAGVVWLNNDPCPPQQLKLGPQSSQYAEIAAILITLQLAATHKIRELLICTDSNYARLSFICHLTGWKRNGFKTANNKPVKHQELSKQATPSSLNTTWSFIGKRSEVIHVNQDKTKT